MKVNTEESDPTKAAKPQQIMTMSDTDLCARNRKQAIELAPIVPGVQITGLTAETVVTRPRIQTSWVC